MQITYHYPAHWLAHSLQNYLEKFRLLVFNWFHSVYLVLVKANSSEMCDKNRNNIFSLWKTIGKSNIDAGHRYVTQPWLLMAGFKRMNRKFYGFQQTVLFIFQQMTYTETKEWWFIFTIFFMWGYGYSFIISLYKLLIAFKEYPKVRWIIWT